ncbi:CPBP family intramembrane glutamic endopeptidase [Tenacibaculum agarivorans]|uniref:CPBP family intramembrane glutamic endopeptidase n=1 Tax=Tenacibaculum agarivorans TaxID=1908389 RepID=UPI00094B91A7|nr:CPBP family intramembrane glutamic endopeptidase [Tenacibaculum agarivorans]
MNYIQQAYKGQLGFWKYLIIPGLFLALMILNFIAIAVLDLDQNELMKKEIESKGENLVLIENMILFVVFLTLLFLWVKFVHKQSLTSLTTSRKKIDWKRFWFSFTLWGAITAIFVLIGYVLEPESMEWNFKPNKFLGLVLIGIIMIPIQTSFEEYLFRGYLMQGIGAKFKSRLIPLIVTSLIFGLLHGANPEVEKLGYIIMVYYIGTGLFLGMITLLDEGLELALGFHAANNLIGALLVTADWTAFQTNSLFKSTAEPNVFSDILIPVLIFFPVLLYIFSKKYKWADWREKLTASVEVPVDNSPIDYITGDSNTNTNSNNEVNF